ncbi:MFS transporter [Nocardioides sp. KIGAM211]|uniref:MFS transporter n=1 Tax=Nocardioides luti TaxID=2761101 RepID=A0A7X0REB9_9ACTN|nr:MFS transporter [Nocardioides luti]MBB6626687.1 MFS transporter [Nocardioides luti]
MADLQTEAEAPGTGTTKHLGWALVLISIAQLMVVLDATIANIALPFIGQDLDISQANLTWIVTGYALSFGGLLLLGGRLGDLYGRRKVFMIGLATFAIASLLGGLATSETLLLGARGLQGFGAALASPAALALITTTFPAGPQRNRAFAIYAAMSGAGAAVGLILGGWLTGLDSVFGLDMSGWRLTFLINVPIGLIAAALAPRVLAESESHPGQLDIPGAVTGTFGLLGVVYGLSRAGQAAHGWDGWTFAALGAGIALLVLFAVIESKVEHPLLPVRIFQNRTRAASFVVMMLVPAAMFAMFFFLSLFIQQLVGYSPLRTGFAFLPFSVGIVLGAGVSSNLVSRVDPRFIAGIGTLFAAGALFGFSRLSIDDSPTSVVASLAKGVTAGADVNYWTSILPFIVMMSFGMGLVFVPLTLTAVHHVRAEDSGIGSGVLNTMQQVGGALGLATLSTVSLHYVNSRVDQVSPALLAATKSAGVDPTAPIPGSSLNFIQAASFQSTFTTGATHAFLVGAVMILLASAVVWAFLDVKHTELATDGPEGAPVHVG